MSMVVMDVAMKFNEVVQETVKHLGVSDLLLEDVGYKYASLAKFDYELLLGNKFEHYELEPTEDVYNTMVTHLMAIKFLMCEQYVS